MEFTKEHKVMLRLLSDGVIYSEAVKFIVDEGTTTNSQISGLENIATVAQNFSQIRYFSKKQADKGNDFFKSLTKNLDELKQKAVSEYGFIKKAETLIKKELKDQTEYYSLLIVREFIHHLSA